MRPAHETVTAEQAAREVAAYRNANEDAREAQGDQAVRDLVDHIQETLRIRIFSGAQHRSSKSNRNSNTATGTDGTNNFRLV